MSGLLASVAAKVGGKLALAAITGAALALCVGLVAWKLQEGQRAAVAGATAHVAAVGAQAGQRAAVDAVAVIDAHSATAEARAAEERTSTDEVNQAPGARDPVGATAIAGLNGLCKSPAYRGNAECLRRANTGALAHSR